MFVFSIYTLFDVSNLEVESILRICGMMQPIRRGNSGGSWDHIVPRKYLSWLKIVRKITAFLDA